MDHLVDKGLESLDDLVGRVVIVLGFDGSDVFSTIFSGFVDDDAVNNGEHNIGDDDSEVNVPEAFLLLRFLHTFFYSFYLLTDIINNQI